MPRGSFRRKQLTDILTDPKVLADRAAEEQKRLDAQAEREKEARRVEAVQSFTPLGQVLAETRTRVYECPFCAAVVSNRERHLNYHDRLNETAQKVDRASFHTTPLG